MVLLQHLPGIGLGLLDPGQEVGGEDGPGPVVASGIAFGVVPAVGAEVLGDLGFEMDLLV